MHALMYPIFKLVAILMSCSDRCVWRHGLHHRQNTALHRSTNLAMLIGTFCLTSLIFVLVILGAVCR